VLQLEDNQEKLLSSHEAGLFITWVELLAALLSQPDEDLSTELEMTLLDSAWSHAVDKRLLQSLLDSLAGSASSSVVEEERVTSAESVAEQLVIKTPTEPEFSLEPENTQQSIYKLSPDDDVHPELLEAFFIETPDQVIEVAELIRHISTGQSDKASHQAAARIAHTIKGSSAVVGIEAVASFAHKLEDILEYSVENQLSPEVADLLVESSDCLEAMFDSLLTQSFPPQQYPQLLEQLTHWDKKFSSGYIYQPPETEPPKKPEKKSGSEAEQSSYKLAWNKDVHPELLEAYMGETPEYVVEISQLLRDINQQTSNESDKKVVRETCQKASRLAHTIKGTSAVVGINAVANIGALLEEILDYAAEQSLPVSLFPLLSESADLLESLYDSLLSEGVPPKEYPQLYEKLSDWRQHLSSEVSTTEQRDEKQEEQPQEEGVEGATIENIDKIEPSTEDTLTNDLSKLNNAFSLNLRPLEDILPIAPIPSLVTSPPVQRANLNETTLRVPVSVIDKLLSFTSELITSNTQMSDQIGVLLQERQGINENNERIRTMLDELEWAVSQQSVSNSKQSQVLPPDKTTKSDGTLMDSLEMDSYNELHSITGLLSEAIEDDRKMSISVVRQLNGFKAQAHTQKQINNEH
jgi:chemotaxis protein histidine kinase CheA